ncbi:hypothetical protein HF086_015128 [Spodoptera exigua]|uniref:Uncharacterized protein n=1 Tax=Spodoptera exigua TaxID=7107 RepID=A0A922MRJ3_SPOEX|nr:hypothetical protein HF086_015128 [Spodoptera exigua]
MKYYVIVLQANGDEFVHPSASDAKRSSRRSSEKLKQNQLQYVKLIYSNVFLFIVTYKDLMDEADGGEDPELDDFDRLRSIREQHRKEKYLQKLMARSISAQQRTGSTELMDNDLLLEDLLSQSAAAQKKEEKLKSDSKDNAT